VHFSQQDATRTNFPDGHFDLICSSILFHETSGKALPAIVRECHPAARAGRHRRAWRPAAVLGDG
jgi:hypothetical protein